MSFFVGLDGSKQPQDLGINANMGVRVSANAATPLVPSLGLGAQAGLALNVSDAAVHVLDQIGGPSKRTQVHGTFGVFQRTASVTWAVAYDLLRQNYVGTATLGQVRADVSYRVAKYDEVGAWLTKRAKGQDGFVLDSAVRLDPISQVNGYYRRTWMTGATTSIWAGVASGHQDIVWVIPVNPASKHVLVYGAELHVPLNDRLAITGSANFLTPTATGTVDAFLGVAFYPGKNAARAATSRFAPVLPVANNPTMAVDVKR